MRGGGARSFSRVIRGTPSPPSADVEPVVSVSASACGSESLDWGSASSTSPAAGLSFPRPAPVLRTVRMKAHPYHLKGLPLPLGPPLLFRVEFPPLFGSSEESSIVSGPSSNMVSASVVACSIAVVTSLREIFSELAVAA